MKHALIVAAMLVATTTIAEAECRYEASRSIAPIDASGITAVRVDSGSGSLEVVGGSGNAIEAKGRACSSRQDDLDEIRIITRRQGSTLEIIAEYPNYRMSWGRSASLDMQISLPSSLDLEIDDGSGSIDVRDAGSVRIDDGSGSIRVTGARSLWIDDGSGDIDIRDIRGPVEIRDGSGDIDIRQITGTVRIRDDGSGDIDIEEVTENVFIDDDGSGGIWVASVGGDLIVGDHGSGGFSFDRISGAVSVRD